MNSVLRMVSIPTLDYSHMAYANSTSNYKSRFSGTTPAKLPSQLKPAAPALLSYKHPQCREIPSLSFRTCPVVAFDVKKVSIPNTQESIPKTQESSPKPCCGCLGRSTIADAVARVIPAVVHLIVYDCNNTARSIGSGIIIDEDGTILTCAHVVNLLDAKGRKIGGKVYATLSSNNKEFEGMVVKAYRDSDIAFVKILNPEIPLPKAKLGCSNELRPGDWVVSIGSSLSLPNSVTIGIVSYLNRTSIELGQKFKRVYLQTDCAFNTGNSGGPLLNLDGEVVGVNDLKTSMVEGMSFAVTIDSISTIIDEYKKSRIASKPYLGFTMIDLNKKTHLKKKTATISAIEDGVLVYSVEKGSQAYRSGILPGDCIIKCGDEIVSNANQVNSILGNRKWPMEIYVKGVEKPLILNPEETNGVRHESRL